MQAQIGSWCGAGAALIALMAGMGVAQAQTGEQPAAPPQEEAPQKADEPAKAETPEAKPKPRFRFGPDYSIFLPQSAAIRSRFGSNWQGWGIGTGRLDLPRASGAIDTDFSVLTSSRNGNRVTLIPAGLRYRTLLGGGGGVRPFVGTTINAMLTETRVTEANLPSRWRGGYGGSAYLGVAFGDNGVIQAGYQWTSKIRGFDFSGTNVGLSYRF